MNVFVSDAKVSVLSISFLIALQQCAYVEASRNSESGNSNRLLAKHTYATSLVPCNWYFDSPLSKSFTSIYSDTYR